MANRSARASGVSANRRRPRTGSSYASSAVHDQSRSPYSAVSATTATTSSVFKSHPRLAATLSTVSRIRQVQVRSTRPTMPASTARLTGSSWPPAASRSKTRARPVLAWGGRWGDLAGQVCIPVGGRAGRP